MMINFFFKGFEGGLKNTDENQIEVPPHQLILASLQPNPLCAVESIFSEKEVGCISKTSADLFLSSANSLRNKFLVFEPSTLGDELQIISHSDIGDSAELIALDQLNKAFSEMSHVGNAAMKFGKAFTCDAAVFFKDHGASSLCVALAPDQSYGEIFFLGKYPEYEILPSAILIAKAHTSMDTHFVYASFESWSLKPNDREDTELYLSLPNGYLKASGSKTSKENVDFVTTVANGMHGSEVIGMIDNINEFTVSIKETENGIELDLKGEGRHFNGVFNFGIFPIDFFASEPLTGFLVMISTDGRWLFLRKHDQIIFFKGKTDGKR